MASSAVDIDHPTSNMYFADIPNSIYRTMAKTRIDFKLMLIGETGLGKSTLVNSLFRENIYSREEQEQQSQVALDERTLELEENKVMLLLRCVETHRTRDLASLATFTDELVQYINTKFEHYHHQEMHKPKAQIVDERVHCCLYLIPPTGSMNQIDIDLMKTIQDKVNIIPVIAKADTLTPEECQRFKAKVMKELERNKIKTFRFPEDDDDEEDEEKAKILQQLKLRSPFAVIGSNDTVECQGEVRRVRKHPWGTIEIENIDHCDFVALSELIIRFCMLDLIETTHNIHHANFKSAKQTTTATATKVATNNNKCKN